MQNVFLDSFVIFIVENLSFCSCELLKTVSFSFHLQYKLHCHLELRKCFRKRCRQLFYALEEK